MSDHISRQDAIEAMCGECEWERKCHEECQHIETLKSLPSAEAVDCTDFVLWLLDEIMDEENWECNAVANGEIIARKLKKLGLLGVKDGYYVRTPSAEAVQGCDGCSYDTRIPQVRCLQCGRYWRDGYARKGGESDD